MHCHKTPSISNFLIISFWHYELSPSQAATSLGRRTAMWCWCSYFTGLLELEMSPGSRSCLLRHSPDGLSFSEDQLLGVSLKHGLYCANSVQHRKLISFGTCAEFYLFSFFYFFFLREVIFTWCEIHHCILCDLVAFSTSHHGTTTTCM